MTNTVRIAPDWGELLKEEFEKPYFTDLIGFVRNEYANQKVYPPGREIFRAFDRCPFSKTKVVIVGQDPYHGEGQANGLCFSVRKGVHFPPSLVNIFKEVSSDVGQFFPKDGDLERWAEQGVLLLNATLTVRDSSPGSHQNKGWEAFTDAVIRILDDKKAHLVFILWGAYAQKKGAFIDKNRHLVLESAHPSPFSAHKGFFGSRPFSKTNEYLKRWSFEPIVW